MPADTAELARLQAWLQDAVTGRDVGPGTHPLRASGRLAPADALAVYRGNYGRRMSSAMATMHPALRHALGEPLFSEVVLDHLRRRPPEGHSLATLDRHLAEYLARDWPERETAGVPVDFVVDLARLECQFHEVWDGPGTEGGAATAPIELEPGTRLRPAPCLRLLASRFPVGTYFRAVRNGERPSLPTAAESFLALSRRAFRVTVTDLDRDRFAVLGAIVGGEPVGQAVGGRAGAWRWVEGWVEAGFFGPSGLRPRRLRPVSRGRAE